MKFRKARVFGLGRRGVSATVVVAFAIAGLPASAPGANAIPIVTRVAGNVSIQSNGGGVRSVGTAERTNEGDTLTTQANGLADVVFADVGRARVGPASVARVQQTSGDLAMRLVSGALCVNVEQSAITVAIGNLAITSGAAPSVFSVVEDAAGPSIVVYEGQVKALGLSAPVTASAGDAFAIDAEGNATLTDFAPLQKRLAGLKCPAADMIAHTQKLAANPPALGNGTVAHSGGGGAGAALGILGGLGLLAAAAGGGGGGKGGSAPQGVVPTSPPTTPPPTSSLVVSPMTMTFSSPNAGSQTFAISGGAPPYSATCSTPAATVTISGNAGTVTPKAAGQCTITVSDSAGRSQTITVVVDAALQTTPAQLSFSDPDAPPQTASISGGTQPYALSGGNCAAGSFTLSGSTITVSPTTLPPNAGCTVGFKDQAGNAGSLPVFVGAFGTLNVTPMMLTFTSTAAPPQTITIAKGNPPFSTSGCTGIVTTTPSSPTTFSVTPVAGPISPLGVSCNLAVSDSVSPSSNVSVKVDGPLTLMPSPLKLGNPSSTGMVAMSGGTGAGYTSTAQSGQCTFSVSGTQLNVAAGATPQDGSCTTRVTDSANNEATLMVSVGKYPTVSLSKGSLAFSTPASPDQTVDVTSGIGPFTASGCTGGATTTVNGTTIKVTPIAPTGGCTVTVTDTTSNNTATFTVTVDAFPALTLDKSALTFPTPTSPVQIVTVTSGTGPYTASGCSGNATPGVSGSKITVTPNAATTTSCSITVTDTASGKTAPISVIVSAPITFLTHPLILTGLSGTDTIGGGNRAYGSTPASTGGCLPSVNGTTLTVLVGATLPGKVCSVTVSDTANPANTGTLNVCNGSCPAGTMLKRQSLASSQAPLSVLPSELISFTSPQDAPVSLTVSTPANAGLVTASSSNQTIAVVGLGKAHNEFTVAPGAGGHGSATVTFTDSAGHRVGIIVSESFGTAHGQPPAGASAASPGASANIAPRAPVAPRLGQSLVTLQPGITSRVTIAEENYAGEYTITGANPAIATVMLNGSGANAALLVQARATGACTVIVRDAAGRQTTLLIRVQAGGLRQAQPAARRPN